jgi:hypothetical protein
MCAKENLAVLHVRTFRPRGIGHTVDSLAVGALLLLGEPVLLGALVLVEEIADGASTRRTLPAELGRAVDAAECATDAFWAQATLREEDVSMLWLRCCALLRSAVGVVLLLLEEGKEENRYVAGGVLFCCWLG